MKISGVNDFLQKWKLKRRTIIGVSLLAIVVMSLILIRIFQLPLISYGIPLISALTLFFVSNRNRPDLKEARQHLHHHLPGLEYSLSVLEKDPKEWNALERFQAEKIKEALIKENTFLPSEEMLYRSAGWIAIATLATIAFVAFIPRTKAPSEMQKVATVTTSQNIDIEKDSAYLENMRMVVNPPAYTQLASKTNRVLSGEVPEGSQLSWKFQELGPVESVTFAFGEDAPTNKRNKKLTHSEIYYYSVRDQYGKTTNSPYYALQVQEDQKPTVEITGIEEYQQLEWRENYNIDFAISITDDYGIADAFISATVAAGQGESVKFREKTFPLESLGQSKFSFSTADLKMEPGSELYFYVMAKDNCPFRIQATKSVTYFVVLKDTISYDYAEDAGMQVDLMPDFFRSQRQIIIDTEKLIAEKQEISHEEFKRRSNELGYDQKLLRLKYGQFLGEEAESGIALENEIEEEHDHDHEDGEHEEVNVLEEYGHAHDHEAEEGMLLEENGTRKEDPSRPEWVEELSHSHDNADENTYFEISLKSKLKAALSVMWDAELHLRLYDPPESLPFQYEALEYLQEIKNHARAYVHRIGFDPPAIKVAEKRLSGDLDEVNSSLEQRDLDYEKAFAEIRIAVGHFSSFNREGAVLTSEEKLLLEEAGRQMAVLALDQPGLLSGLSLIRKIINRGTIADPGELDELLQFLLRSIPSEKEQVTAEKILMHPVNRAAIEAL